MKKLVLYISLSLLLLLVVTGGAQANVGTEFGRPDAGPWYLYWDNSCWVIRVYTNAQKTMYGEEIGCPNPHKVGGRLSRGAALGYEYLGDPRIYEINTDNTIKIWENLGTSLSLFNQGTWHMGPPPAASDLERIRALPSPNE